MDRIRRKPHIAFLAILGLALAIRLVLALSWDGYWGVDGGASLLSLNYVLGDEPTGVGFPKPPLAPGYTLAPFVLTMGADIGYKVWSAVFAVLVLIPVYLLARRYVGAWPAVGTALFASVDWYWAEMFVTGSHPLVAFALIGMAWYAMAEKANEPPGQWWTWNSTIIAVSIALIPWVNQTAAGLAIIVLPVYFFGLCWFHRSLLLKVLTPCLLAGPIALGALPWYMQTLPGSELLTYDGPTIYWAWGLNTVQSLFIALPLGIYAIWRIPNPSIKAMGVVLLTLAALVPWLSYDEVLINPPYRARYLMALAFYPVMAWVVFRAWMPGIVQWRGNTMGETQASVSPIAGRRGAHAPRLSGIFIVASLAACIYMGSVFIWVVRDQAAISAMVTPETAEALEVIQNAQAQAPPEAPQGAATNAFTLSLWVAGLNKIPSPFLTTAPPPPAYIRSDILLRCVFGWVDDCDGRDSARSLGIRYLLVEERFPRYNQYAPDNYLAPDNQWEVTANTEWLHLVYSAGTTRLYEVW